MKAKQAVSIVIVYIVQRAIGCLRKKGFIEGAHLFALTNQKTIPTHTGEKMCLSQYA